ncbi:hypothetical protein RGQ29_000182 [Quercus rubra]|uniref:RIN4 pathogenic type III effector avirulence factor Avr cleavage site domain-containing protein n=1 Tax=Quercus rubra TaxID=3512 RepID=A0AAN7JCC7_QUERU|nr:hypothetical protein RGQ29_000182 [Quercus rubra]
MDEYCKRSGQIPTFGDWDNANELPITQYFECARQAGLIRYSSSSSGETDHHPYVRGDLYAVDFNKPSRFVPSSRKTTRERAGGGVREREREREKRYNNNNNHHHRHPQLKEQKKVKAAQKVCDVTEPSTKTTHTAAATTIQNDAVPPPPPPPPASKPIDEDLYKIPPELLLHTSKRKKILGFFSRCLAPACAA